MRDRYPHAATLAALLCLAAACADACVPGDRAQRDAAQRPAWPPGQEWRIEPEPALVIGAPGAVTFTRDFTPQRVSDDDVQRATRGRPAQPGEELAVAEWLPAYDRMLVDAHGNLWVRGYGWRVWSVFDAAGRWLGEVEAPRGLRVHQIAADHVVGVMRDSLDVESVAVYRLVRPVAAATP